MQGQFGSEADQASLQQALVEACGSEVTITNSSDDAVIGVADDNFGYSVALSGDTALVGAPYDDAPAGVDGGSAYVFTRSGTQWSPQTQLTADDGGESDYFGVRCHLRGRLRVNLAGG